MFERKALLICSKDGEWTSIMVRNLGHVCARVTPYKPNNEGCVLSMVIEDKTDSGLLLKQAPTYLRLLLENFFWTLVEQEFTPDPVFEAFRTLK